MRLAFLRIKPKSIYEIAICLAIIRPAADQSYDDLKNISSKIIFDDDAIDIIAQLLNISDADADKFRRAFAKNDKVMINEFKKLINHLSSDEQTNILNKLNKLSSYSFCKAHAFSYAQLIYKLAFMKVHYPSEFWKATLNNCQSSYKKWVHIFEAAQFNIYSKNDVSIYAINRKKKINNLSIKEQLIKFGYWEGQDFYPDCYYDETSNKFNGIIASIRLLRSKEGKFAMIFLGVSIGKYLQLNIIDFKPNGRFIGVNGVGYFKSKKDKLLNVLTCEKYNTW
jgi:DNA polymerase III alpha subunit